MIQVDFTGATPNIDVTPGHPGVTIDVSKRGPAGPRGEQGPGVGEAVASIASERGWRALRAALDAGTARMIAMGDSKSEGAGVSLTADRWLDVLMGRLRARYAPTGDQGLGYLPAYYATFWGFPSAPTTSGSAVTVGNGGGLGNRSRHLAAGGSVTWTVPAWTSGVPLLVHWTQHPGLGDLEVVTGGTVRATITTAGSTIASKVTPVTIPAGATSVTIRHKSGTGAGNAARVEGIVHRTATTGVVIYDGARSGAKVVDYSEGLGSSGTPDSEDYHWQAVAAVAPHAVIMAFGANDQSDPPGGRTVSQWANDLRVAVAKAKAAAPGAGIVLLHGAQRTEEAGDPSRILAFEAAARDAIGADPDVSILYESQLWAPVVGEDYADGDGIWLSDRVHTNVTANRAIARMLFASITSAEGGGGGGGTGSPQTLSLAGNNLSLSGGGGTVTLPSGGGTGAVSSVNGKTGAVSLSAADVSALPSTYMPPAQSWGQITGKPTAFPVEGHTHWASDIVRGGGGPVPVDALGNGSASSSTVLHGDGQWRVPSTGGGGATDTTTHYAPATTTSNDTSALLSAMQAAKDAGKAFRAAPGRVYTIDPITVPTGLRIDGALSVKGRTPGQSHVLRLSGAAYELSGSSLIVDGNGAVDGLQLFNAGRSRFGYVDVRYAARNGIHLMQTDGTVTTPNNNNQTSWSHVVVAQCGTKRTTSATVASQTGGPTVINQGYTTLTLSTALPAWAPDVRVVDSGDETVLSAYLVVIAGKAYRVKSVKSTTSIEIYNYPATSAGTSLTVDVLLGAGFNSPMFRDNQAGYIANLDAISNPAIGLNAGAAYGWSYAKSAYQGCGVGVNVQNFTQGANWIGPYFELNVVDMVIGTNADATITSPQWAEHKLQSLWDRLSSRGEGSHPGLKVIGSTSGAAGRVGPLTANEPPTTNPGTLSISPGYTYAFQRTVGNPSLRIAPSKNALLYGANVIQVALECTGTWSGTVGFTMLTGGDYFPDTVMGGSTYTTPTLSAGSYLFTVFRVGTDWRVTYIKGA